MVVDRRSSERASAIFDRRQRQNELLGQPTMSCRVLGGRGRCESGGHCISGGEGPLFKWQATVQVAGGRGPLFKWQATV